MSSIPHDHTAAHGAAPAIGHAVDHGHAHDEHAHYPGGVITYERNALSNKTGEVVQPSEIGSARK